MEGGAQVQDTTHSMPWEGLGGWSRLGLVLDLLYSVSAAERPAGPGGEPGHGSGAGQRNGWVLLHRSLGRRP